MDNFKKYAKLDAQIKELEDQRKQLKEDILQELKKENTDKVVKNVGSFTVSHRTSFDYTQKIKDMNEKIKVAKAKEEQSGKATPKVTEYITFTPPKE